jgi:hypothetical protein
MSTTMSLDFIWRVLLRRSLQTPFRIAVDGKQAGKGDFTLVGRRSEVFYELCHMQSGDLASTGSLFFDNRGRPVLESIKSCIPKEDRRFLVYLDKLEVDNEYRQHTWIGACAIPILLTKGIPYSRWSIAIYIPEARSQYDDKDLDKSYAMKDAQRASFLGLAAATVDEEWEKRLNFLVELDMRQFFRAGFLQAKDAEERSKCHYLFAVPSFTETSVPMMPHTQAIEVPVF